LASPRNPPGRLAGAPDVLEGLARAGIRTVADALRASTCVRDLPERSNHRLVVDGVTYHLKREKRGGDPPREARGIRRLRAAGVPTAPLSFEGVDPALGALTATSDLAPARPADDLLREGALEGAARRTFHDALARAVAALHDAGLHHRDLYLNHVYLAPERPGQISLVDLERVGRHRRRLGRRVVKDLAALCASVPDGSGGARAGVSFVARYARLRGLGGRARLARLARRVARKARRIRRHVPRTPVGPAAAPSASAP